MFAIKLAAPLSRTVASATSRSCIRPLSASVSNSRLFDEVSTFCLKLLLVLLICVQSSVSTRERPVRGCYPT
ncbi:unnamed protein product [Ixodes pacificus]